MLGGMLSALAFASVVGCGGGPGNPDWPRDVQWSSEHFDYDTRGAEMSACQGVLTTLERHRLLVMGYLGLPDSGQRITYRKYLDAADLAAVGACPTVADGCEHSRIVESARVFHQHELVHAYLDDWGNPPPLFREGVAEALSCEGAVPDWPPYSVNWRDVGVDPSLGVDELGRMFVGYLLHTYGAETFMRLYQGDWYADSNDEIAAHFLDVYGRALDDAWHEALAVNPDAICVRVWECASPAISVAEDPLDFTQSCDGTGDYGTVTVDQPALLDAHDGSGLSIQSCGDGGPHIDPPGGSQQILTELQPGTVFLTATSNDPPWRATLGPVLPGGASCPVVPFPLPPLDGIVGWTFAARAPTETLWLSLSSPLAAAFFVNEPVVYAGPDSTDVYGCTDCSGASCVELSSSQAAALSVGALRIDPTAPAADGFIYARIGAQVPTQP